MVYLVVLIIIAIFVGLWVVATYNYFVSSKARIKAAVQEIGNQLKRQADLIPNLEASVKGYLKQEKGIFKDLTNARKSINAAIKSGDLQEMSNAGSRLANILPEINVVVEDNPELKSSEVVAGLMSELRDTADKIMYARRLVIDLSADYNVRRVTLPSNIIASIFNFEEMKGLETPGEGDHVEAKGDELKTPMVDL